MERDVDDDDALTFLRRQTRDKPWFLMVSWNPPHPPFNPPQEDAAPYPADKMELRPNIETPTPESVIFTPWVKNEETLRAAEQGYYGSIAGIDKEVARILATLEETGQADNTIVIYTSDHGEMMGSHGLGHKEAPFEESCHVPFFIKTPGVTKAGASSPALFGAIDIFPTPFYRGIRTDTHTYAVTEEGRWILYDNVADPYQQKNLVRDPALKPLMEKLDEHIIAWQASVGDTFQFRDVLQNISSFPS
jgi:membrane-anchored protein YejM (alkaline phosphatase superfamily)